MITCQCPSAIAIPNIGTLTNCPESFGQIQKVAFARLNLGTGVQEFESLQRIETLASWTAKITASGGEKITISPYIQAPTEDGGDAITFGGGNDTPSGISIIVGSNPVNFSGVLRAVPQYNIDNMKRLICEAQGGNLGVFLFDENGRIECESHGTTFRPIPIRNFFVGDKIHGGLEAPDSNAISWSYLPNYSDKLTIVTPSFNPLTDLNN